RRLLEGLPAHKLRPAPDDLPGRWMTGTQSHEGIAGTLAAIEYLADLGRKTVPRPGRAGDRRGALQTAYEEIVSYERELCRELLQGLAGMRAVKVHGITDAARLAERVPTISLNHARRSPREVAEHLDRRGIFAWHGNFYALALSEALGLEPEGMVRIGLLHYNTAAEVQRLLTALAELEE